MDKLIKRFALQNALKYEGKANIGAVLGQVFSSLKVKDKGKIIEKVKEIVNEVNSLSLKEQEQQYKSLGVVKRKRKVRVGLPNLQGAKKGKVVMRLAPFPSGALHIGNARVFILNDEYTKKYKGKLLLVIDDTIGSKEKSICEDAYKLIPEGLRWLKIKFSKTVYKSDRLKIYYKYAEKLIKEYKAYVCFCDIEKLRENRAKGIECECRNRSVKDNLKEWKNMLTKYKEGKAVLRLKTDMQDPNPAFRDRVMFRISERKHPRVKYSVWPLLEFSWAIDDHLLGITHIIRGKELMMESKVEEYIWKIFKWKKPVIVHTGLLQLQSVKLSKSKSRKEVDSKKYTGWDDPRTWSLQSLERRGIRPEAVRKFILSFGLTQTEITIPIENLYMENKKIIDKKANRYFFIWNPKKIKIKNAPELTAKVPMHPDFLRRGYRKFKAKDAFYISDELDKGKYYRFMHLFNFKDGNFASVNYDPSMKVVLIHWLPVSKELVDVEVLLENGTKVSGLGESALKKLKIGEIIQFERFSFVKLEKKGKKLEFIWVHR